MPSYDFRCKMCNRAFVQFYKTVRDYEAAAAPPCPHCGSAQTARRIRRVAVAKSGRDLANLSSTEMLSVLESGDSRQVGALFDQVGQSAGVDMGAAYQEAAQRLARGDDPAAVERDLDAAGGSDAD